MARTSVTVSAAAPFCRNTSVFFLSIARGHLKAFRWLAGHELQLSRHPSQSPCQAARLARLARHTFRSLQPHRDLIPDDEDLSCVCVSSFPTLMGSILLEH